MERGAGGERGGASAAGGAQVAYFGALQLSTFYLLLGISCQYAFLYFDAYVQSLVEPLVAAALATRVTYMCQRATPVRALSAPPILKHSKRLRLPHVLSSKWCHMRVPPVHACGPDVRGTANHCSKAATKRTAATAAARRPSWRRARRPRRRSLRWRRRR